MTGIEIAGVVDLDAVRAKAIADEFGTRAFARIEDVISQKELLAITGGYKKVAGYTLEDVAKRVA